MLVIIQVGQINPFEKYWETFKIATLSQMVPPNCKSRWENIVSTILTRIPSSHLISYHIVSYPILSYHILLNQIRSWEHWADTCLKLLPNPALMCMKQAWRKDRTPSCFPRPDLVRCWLWWLLMRVWRLGAIQALQKQRLSMATISFPLLETILVFISTITKGKPQETLFHPSPKPPLSLQPALLAPLERLDRIGFVPVWQ